MTSRAAPALPIGVSDFRQLREQGLYYVDKTGLVRAVIDSGAQALLLPRPRRFGKTLNLSMLRWYFERNGENIAPLFDDLAVARAGSSYRDHFQRHPVVFLTFKDVKASSFADCLASVSRLVAAEFGRHARLLDGGTLAPHERRRFERVLHGEAEPVDLQAALGELSSYLARASGERAVILVDEYDTPIHAGYQHRYYDDAIGFFRNFFSAGFKDNPHLYKGVLTGILRVARESIFSGLNNLSVHTVLSLDFAADFGFTEEEVAALARAVDVADRMEGIRDHYNGYRFGGRTIYNPWSVLNYAARPGEGFRPYWVSTGSDDLVRDLILRGGAGLRGELETLLGGGAIEKTIDENIVLRDLPQRPDAVWSFLLFSGYLQAAAVRLDERGLPVCTLAIPNRELRTTYETVFRGWLDRALGGNDRVEALLRALLSGDADGFERLLEELIVESLSFHDFAGATPERVYQAFIVGLLVQLAPRFEVRSNRESGHGRYDVSVIPREPNQPGVVLELKVLDARRGETVEEALASALAQIRERDYAAELRTRGAAPVHEIAAVFDGKRAWARAASER